MRFKIKIKEEEHEGSRKGLFQLSRCLGDRSYRALVLCPLNEACLNELKVLDGFEFEFSKQELEKQNRKEVLELIESSH